MERCPPKFSKLDRENEVDKERSVGTGDKLEAPKSGIRILDSLTSNGFHHRRQEDDNNESPTRVLESPKASITHPSPRQCMVEATTERVVATSSESTLRYSVQTMSPSWKTQPMYDKVETEMMLRWNLQPVHDDALTSLSIENETEFLLGIPREAPSLDAERSQVAPKKNSSKVSLFALLKDDEKKLRVNTRSSIPRSQEVAAHLFDKRRNSSAPLDVYNDIQLLVARVKQLDALSKVGEVAAVASVDCERAPTISNVKKGVGGTPSFLATDRSQQDEAVVHAKCHEEETAPLTVQELVDGSNDFQVIYRRQPGNTGNILGTTAASSIATMSSCGVLATTTVNKPLLMPHCASRESPSSAKQLTPHPFFWRTHPPRTFISSGPYLPQKLLSPMRNKSFTNQDIVINLWKTAPSSSIGVPLSIRKTAEEIEKNEKDSEQHGSDTDTTFRSSETDPIAVRPQDLEVLSEWRHSTQQPSPACRRFKDEELLDTRSGSSILFPEFQFSTSWTEA